MDNTAIYTQGKGKYGAFTVNGISGYHAFAEDSIKQAYIDALEYCDNEDTCLIAYCVLTDSAHFIVKGVSKRALTAYANRVNASFYETAQIQGFLEIGYPFRDKISKRYFKAAKLKEEVSSIHRLPETFADFTAYPYSSYADLMDGRIEAVNVIRCEFPNLTKRTFGEWFMGKGNFKVTSVNHYESYSDVIKSAKDRYLLEGASVTEEEVVFVMSEVCDRTKLSYNTARRRMGIPKKRRDVMIAVLSDMINRRGHNFYQAVNIMRLNKENRYNLITEIIVEANRLHGYSYDHIVNALEVNDVDYNMLVDILVGMHKQFGYGFVEMAKMFHLQNDIISIRNRCEF